MPKRDVGFIAHSALTNHRIVRTAEEPLPGAAFKQTTDALPDLIHFNRIPGKSPPPAIVLMQAYGELMERHPPYVERFQAMLNQAAREAPDHPLVAAALGRRALRAGAPAEAIPLLMKALERGSESYTTFEDLGDALSQSGRLDEAVKALQRGLELAPFTPVLHKSLALRYINLRRYDDARRTLGRYLELFPEDDFVRGLWKQVTSGARSPAAR
jgi:Flp pilus assembly protein TadD